MADERPARFACMELAAADKECATITSRENFLTKADDGGPLRCPNCRRSVFLHCSMCRIQITGCICTEIDRFGKDEAWQRVVQQYGNEIARAHYEAMGLWVPPEFRLER